MSEWEVHAVKYADRTARTRRDSFIFDDNHDAPHADGLFHVGVAARGDEVILVDTGYDSAEARRARPPDPAWTRVRRLRPSGCAPEDITEIIVTHLHYDHAGGLHLFPNAHAAYAGGRDGLCDGALHVPRHAADAVYRRPCLRGGQAALFRQGDLSRRRRGDWRTASRCIASAAIRAGLQAVRVRTAGGLDGAGLGCGALLRESVACANPFPSSLTCRTCWTDSTRWTGWPVAGLIDRARA